MDGREFNIGAAWCALTGYPFLETHVVADNEQAVIYVRAGGVHVVMAYGVAGSSSGTSTARSSARPSRR
jgi:hypothetical protein